MPRLLFEKTGNAVWLSHLDLMRLFQRAFKRAGLCLKHTQGFNPRPSVSIALPLSVGLESRCELLDFELDHQVPDYTDIVHALNRTLVTGVNVLDCYGNGRKLHDLSLLRCAITLEYDDGIPDGADKAIHSLLNRQSVIVPKKSKNGVQEQDIIPMIHRFALSTVNLHILQIEALICCQNPTLNPMQLAAAIELYLPQFKADFIKCKRIEVFDANQQIFR